MALTQKKEKLVQVLKEHSPLAVAVSGGNDSALVLAVAKQVMGDGVIAVTSVSPLHGEKARADALRIASEIGVQILEVESGRLEHTEFVENRTNRCYTCKTIMFNELQAAARNHGAGYLADGVCADDFDEYRPGLAAGRECGVVSPLALAGFSKTDIRKLSKEIGLSTWNKPPGACLATRIPYGTPITPDLLDMIGRAEQLVLDEGFSFCRVRYHGKMAKIEVPADEVQRLVERETRERIITGIKKIGFSMVCADLSGYLSGSMDILAGNRA